MEIHDRNDFHEIRDKIRLQILRSIGNLKI